MKNFSITESLTVDIRIKAKYTLIKNLKDNHRESREKLGLWEYEKDIKITNIDLL